MYTIIKKYFKTHFPDFFIRARNFKDQTKIEINTLKQVGILRILKQFIGSKKKWKIELPLQKSLRLKLDIESLEVFCKQIKNFKEGGHTYYFPPHSVEISSLKDIIPYGPRKFGAKIIKHKGGIDKSFVAPNKACKSYELFSPSHKDLLLVHNLFFNLKMGPRLYDIEEIQFQNGDIHVAYIMEHIDGKIAAQAKCENFIQDIKKLEAENLIKLINWNGYEDMDFVCPECNGNLIYDSHSKSPKYVDLQNFSLGNYYNYLKKIALEASEASHFGQKSYLMGGKYLYQEIPGLNLTAKRSPSERFKVLKKLLIESNITLENKFIIDVGCNLGLMGAQYLKEGAAWLHGFDFPQVVPYAEKVLLSIGCTRFSLTGIKLSKEVSLKKHLSMQLKGCVISYLAIRGHIGWIEELSDIPWEFMIYEGHENEDLEMNKNFLKELNKIKPCHVLTDGWISDANSAPRYIAILKAKQ
ncbi:MAG: hypothetical protein WCG05_04045 [Alphaproteobacteria bacterium]